MRPLQELLASCQSQQSGPILSLASPRKRRRTRNESDIVRSAGRASARAKADGRFAKMLVRIVVRSQSVREGTVSDRIRRVPTRGRKLAWRHSCAHHLIGYVMSHPVFDLFVYSMYVCIFSLSLDGSRFLYLLFFPDDPPQFERGEM